MYSIPGALPALPQAASKNLRESTLITLSQRSGSFYAPLLVRPVLQHRLDTATKLSGRAKDLPTKRQLIEAASIRGAQCQPPRLDTADGCGLGLSAGAVVHSPLGHFFCRAVGNPLPQGAPLTRRPWAVEWHAVGMRWEWTARCKRSGWSL